jgi:RNA polymerase sigma-70 factor (ECF subfamily)
MSLAQEGDKAAYALLLKEVTPWLRSVSYKAGIERDDLEDAVQDVLLTVHSVRHTYDPDRPFAPWLAAIARHRLIDRLRKSGKNLAREIPLTEEHETFSADETNSLEDRDEARLLHGAISQLSDGQRQAVELLKLKELSLKEASQQSGQSEQALKVSVHRAIKRLRILLTEGKVR